MCLQKKKTRGEMSVKGHWGFISGGGEGDRLHTSAVPLRHEFLLCKNGHVSEQDLIHVKPQSTMVPKRQ